MQAACCNSLVNMAAGLCMLVLLSMLVPSSMIVAHNARSETRADEETCQAYLIAAQLVGMDCHLPAVTLMRVKDSSLSGCMEASWVATIAPMEWPMTWT